jgi:hypothetical protein
MLPLDSQNFESYVPVYDVVPENWEDARGFITEQLKKITTAVNLREIGWYLDLELLTGQAFIPGVAPPGNSSPPQYRQILRKVVNCSPLVIGINTFPHGIVFDANFTLMKLYAGATNSSSLMAEQIPNEADQITMDATNLYIHVFAPWDRCFTVIEYIQEL